jgi:hypothetical protein
VHALEAGLAVYIPNARYVLSVNPGWHCLQLEADALQISPSSPLVSTALQENAWVCGEYIASSRHLGSPQISGAISPPAFLTDHLPLKTTGKNAHNQLGVSDGGVVVDPQPLRSLRLKALDIGDGHCAAVGDRVRCTPCSPQASV